MSSDLPHRIDDYISGREQELIELRRHLHRHPELSHEEFQTTQLLSARLTAAGFDVAVRPEKTGFYADLASPGFDPERHATVAIRCDLDALAIEELTSLEFKSANAGVMHACGHDVHMTCAYGSGLALASVLDGVEGRVRLIYQHAEELVGGADQMVQFGAVQGVDWVLALHVDPELPVGKVGVRRGAFTAAFDEFKIRVIGESGHGARPHHCIDPIFVTTQLANALYNAVGRSMDARDPMVLSIGMIGGGHVPNVIPDEAFIAGSVRTLSQSHREAVEPLLVRICDGICGAHGARYHIDLRRGAPAIVNDAEVTDLVAEVSREVLGFDAVHWIPLPSMGSEDYSYFLEHARGAMFRLGVATEGEPKYFLHSARLSPNEAAIPLGARILARTALQLLDRGKP